MICPACRSLGREIQVAQHYMKEPLYTCEGCGLVFADRKSSEETFQAWEGKIDNYDPTWPAARARLVYVAEFLKQNGLCNDVFDISMGDGFFMEECQRRGAMTAGMNDNFVGYGMDKVEVICINWTLENTADPVGMLRWAGKHAKYVCVATGSRILVPFKKPLWAYLDDSPAYLHPQHFSRGTLSSTMGYAGMAPHATNRFMDTDYLVSIAHVGTEQWWAGDNTNKVIEWFERWHEDSKCYARG